MLTTGTMSLRLLWRPVLKLFLGLGLGLALGGMFWACAQGEGDRCERDEDCSGNLRCARSSGSISGRCTSGSLTPPMPDASMDTVPVPPAPDAVDQAVPMDAPADTTPQVDAGPDIALGG